MVSGRGADRSVVLGIVIVLGVTAVSCSGSPDAVPASTTTTAAPVSATSTTTSTTGVPSEVDADRPLLPPVGDPAHESLVATVGADYGIAVAALTGDGSATVTVASLGPLATGVAWSTIKVPMAMAVITQGVGERFADDIRRALTASDNEAAMRLWAHLGGGEAAARAVTEQIRAAGDEQTVVESEQVHPPYSPYGQTAWALEDQARFALGLACSEAGTEVQGAMRQVVADQRWGLGSPGPGVAFKGGWGPGSEPGVAGGYFVRQVGVLTIDGRQVGVAVASRPQSGAFEDGTHDLSAIAAWIGENLALDAVSTASPCEALGLDDR